MLGLSIKRTNAKFEEVDEDDKTTFDDHSTEEGTPETEVSSTSSGVLSSSNNDDHFCDLLYIDNNDPYHDVRERLEMLSGRDRSNMPPTRKTLTKTL